jgi:hypothetical protein
MSIALERKADEEIKIPAPTLEELQKLDKNKANRIELDNLKQEVDRLEQLVARFDEEFTEGEGLDDSYFEGEESEDEDVLSLGEVDGLDKMKRDDHKEGVEEDKVEEKEKQKENQEKENKEDENKDDGKKEDEKKEETQLEIIKEVETEKKLKLTEKPSENNIIAKLAEDKRQLFNKTVKVEIDIPKHLEKVKV